MKKIQENLLNYIDCEANRRKISIFKILIINDCLICCICGERMSGMNYMI